MRVPSAAALLLLLALAGALPPPSADAAVFWYRVFAGIGSPIEVTHAGDGSNRLFLVQQTGRIFIAKAGVVLPTPFLDVGGLISGGGERGLLGLAFHPQFASNRQFFVNYTRSSDGATVIARYTASAGNPDVADVVSATILLTIAQPYSNHNGGAIKFGPDGYLYIGMGDGGSANDPEARAQDKTTLLGKILRIDVNSGSPYAIPPTNPFPTGVGGRAEIFAIGMRNPWRISFDRGSGDLWIGDVGQNAVEEIDRLAAGTGAGANFGWRMLEGNTCTGLGGPLPCADPTLTAPVITYSHALGCSVTGGYVYRGAGVPDLVGKYLYGDYCTGRLWSAQNNGMGQWIPAELSATGFGISSFGEDEAGELYFANYSTGDIFRFVATPPAAPQLTLSRFAVGFGDVNVGATSSTRSVNVSNTGGGTLTLSSLTPGGANSGEFTRGGSCAPGSMLAAGQTCTITYQFAPATAGGRSATLAIVTSDGNASLSLSGNGLGAANPVLGMGATTLAFGSINVGASSATQTFNVTNTGGGTLALTTLTAGGANPGDFMRTGTCANGTLLAAAQSCTVTYQFTPAASGARSASLAVASNGGNANVTLSGTGVAVATPVLGAGATALAFGNVNLGASSATQTFNVTNAGGGTLSLTTLTAGGANPGDFTRTGTCTNGTLLAAAQSCTVTYQFLPTVAGARSASLALATNAGSALVTLSGTGVAGAAVFAVAPGALDFGALAVGVTGTPQILTVTNTGTANLTLGLFALGGANPGDFLLAGSCAIGAMLVPAASCTVSVRFHPLLAGARAATLSFSHDAPGSPTAVPLTGTGGAAPVVVDVIEFYHAGFDHYFISSLPADINALDSGTFKGWVRTGRTFRALATTMVGATPVCRFYLPAAFGDSHFYSASPAECFEVLVRFPGFIYESPGVMYMYLPDPITGACPPPTVPVYRVWNRRVDTNHRYMTDRDLRDAFVAMGYVAEGYGPDAVAMCAQP